jgi:hypothetical protein
MQTSSSFDVMAILADMIMEIYKHGAKGHFIQMIMTALMLPVPILQALVNWTTQRVVYPLLLKAVRHDVVPRIVLALVMAFLLVYVGWQLVRWTLYGLWQTRHLVWGIITAMFNTLLWIVYLGTVLAAASLLFPYVPQLQVSLASSMQALMSLENITLG